ncbi:MAG TPA: hypothetical protein VER79_06825, partial [Candidatus Limnocylindrales bacterium]|nr:hypothetical protein [Candidatus Limnocylindrales bacterium]
LGVTRAQIAAYCARHDIAARDDATNADTALTRGWLRHELLPLMHSRCPGAARALSDLADSAALDESLLEAMFTQTLLAQASVTENAVRLPRALFRDAHLALQRRFVRWAATRLAPGAELSHERTDAAVQFLRTGAKGQMIELAGGVGVWVLGEEILIALRAEAD